MKTLSRFIIFISVLLFTSCAKDIVDLTGSISGLVKDFDNGQLISNCRVSLSPGGKSVTTGADGAFGFTDLEPGQYTLSFSKAGYNDETSTVSIVASRESSVSVLLKAKAAFVLSEDVLDFGDLEETKSVQIMNNSANACSYQLGALPTWASCNKLSGTVQGGSSELLTITVDRPSVAIGEYRQIVSVSYSGQASGSVSLTLKMNKVVLAPPTVSTASTAINITKDSFDIKGNISATGGSKITAYGHCWSLTKNPTIEDSKTELGSTDAVIEYTSSVTGLSPMTTYYVRAYATNAQGTSYGEQISVTTENVASDKWDGTKASSFASGSGTAVDPYVIETGAQLVLVRDKDNAYYVLNNNIDLDNRDWQPFNFRGNLDGKGFIIQNLKVVKDSDNLGLISSLEGTVSNLSIVGVNINVPTRSNIGALAGSAGEGASVSNCTVSLKDDSKLVGNSCVGGLIGYVKSSILTVQQCRIESSSSGDVIKGNGNVGGLIGYYRHGSTAGSKDNVAILEDHVSANLFGGTSIGGIFGYFAGWNDWDFIIKNCEFQGELTGETYIGGILGSFGANPEDYCPKIEGCKASVSIIASGDIAGGIVGGDKYKDSHSVTIIASYSSGTITCSNPSTAYLGGLCGQVRRVKHEAILCYSTITSSSKAFEGLAESDAKMAGLGAKDCATVAADSDIQYGSSMRENCAQLCKDITSFLYSCYSDYAENYNFNKTWIWKGKINGEDVEVSCPKLAWE